MLGTQPVYTRFPVKGEFTNARVSQKKVFLGLGHIDKCGFLYGVQHVSNITFQVFLGVVKF